MTYLSSAFTAQGAQAQSQQVFLFIPGQAGHEISLSGEVRDRRTGRFLAIYPKKTGRHRFYHYCSIGSVHRLLMAALCGRPLTRFEQVRHLDNDTFNNQASNLAVGDARANAADRLAHGTYGKFLTASHVREIRRLAASRPPAAIARLFGVSVSHVRNILKGRCWSNLP